VRTPGVYAFWGWSLVAAATLATYVDVLDRAGEATAGRSDALELQP